MKQVEDQITPPHDFVDSQESDDHPESDGDEKAHTESDGQVSVLSRVCSMKSQVYRISFKVKIYPLSVFFSNLFK